MLSQFIGGAPGLRMLGDIDYPFPDGIHAIGRLDNHSEGLLLLTTNPKVTKLLFESTTKHPRTYLVQVYREISEDTIEQLRTGVPIRIKGGLDYTTTPCEVNRVSRPENMPFGHYELRNDIPNSWLQITLTEGKFRQVRKMLTAVRHRCMRLIRLSIEDLQLGDLAAGAVRELDEATFFRQLNIRE